MDPVGMADEPDEPLWDPDRMRFPEDLDVNNLDQVQAWLNDPVSNALVEDLGRQFRQLPAAQQRPEVIESLKMSRKTRDLIAKCLDGDVGEPELSALQDLLRRAEAHMDAAKLRLLELDDEE